MEKSFSVNDTYDFIKLLVEVGGVYYVDNDHCIRRTGTEEPVGVKIPGSKDVRKVALCKEGMTANSEYVLLKPFAEELGKYPERDWFTNVLSIVPGCLMSITMNKIAELANDKQDIPVNKSAVVGKFIEKIDANFIDELNRLRPVKIGSIFYDKQKHTAVFQSDVWDKDFEAQLKGKVRKSSWTAIRGMVKEMIGTDKPETIFYTSNLVGCSKMDAIVHVYFEVLKRISKVVETITDLDLHVAELEPHMSNIAAYHKAMQWISSTSASSKAKMSDPTTTGCAVPPWKQTGFAAGARAPVMTPAVITPGVTINPSYKEEQQVEKTVNDNPIPLPETGVTKNVVPNGMFMMGGQRNTGPFACARQVIPPIRPPNFPAMMAPNMFAQLGGGIGTGFGW